MLKSRQNIYHTILLKVSLPPFGNFMEQLRMVQERQENALNFNCMLVYQVYTLFLLLLFIFMLIMSYKGQLLGSYSLKVLCGLMCVASVLAFPEYHIQRILRGGGGGGGGGGSSGGRSTTSRNNQNNKKQECPKKNVTFTNSDGSTGWKIKKVCSDDGWIIGICIGAVVVAYMLCMLLCQYLNDLERKRNVQKCEKEEHSLRRTDGVEFYNRGYVEYKYTWFI